MPHKCKCGKNYKPLGHPFERQFQCTSCGRYRADKQFAPMIPTGIQYAKLAKECERLAEATQDEKVAEGLLERAQLWHKRVKQIENICANLQCTENHFQLKDHRKSERSQFQQSEQIASPSAPQDHQRQPIAQSTDSAQRDMPGIPTSKQKQQPIKEMVKTARLIQEIEEDDSDDKLFDVLNKLGKANAK